MIQKVSANTKSTHQTLRCRLGGVEAAGGGGGAGKELAAEGVDGPGEGARAGEVKKAVELCGDWIRARQKRQHPQSNADLTLYLIVDSIRSHTELWSPRQVHELALRQLRALQVAFPDLRPGDDQLALDIIQG